jgi:hypothetical protein
MKCGKSKLLTDFVKSKSNTNGRKNTCKDCKNIYRKAGLGWDVPIELAKQEYERKHNEFKEKELERLKKRAVEMTCTNCKQTKPVSNFRTSQRGKNGRTQPCKNCCSVIRKAYKSIPRVKEKARLFQKERARKLRSEILNAYGGECSCCGEKESQFLAVDHINNDGAQHRKQIGGTGALYLWLKKNNFPKDRFQLLCHNCNMAKSLYGICPHQEKRE